MFLTAYSFESPSIVPEEIENFTLSKTRLNKTNIIYSDERVLCVRIKEKMVGYIFDSPGITPRLTVI